MSGLDVIASGKLFTKMGLYDGRLAELQNKIRWYEAEMTANAAWPANNGWPKNA